MNEHKGPVIEVVGEDYAYQACPVTGGFRLRARPPQRGPVGEAQRFLEYHLEIDRHTGTAVSVTLRKIRSANEVVAQRNRGERATEAEVYTTTMTFQQLVNRLLGPGCQVFEDKESLPPAAIEAMKGCYDDHG